MQQAHVVRSVIISSMLLLSSAIHSQLWAQGPALHEQLTLDAWKARDEKKYDEAITKAQECIREFQGLADEMQAELRRKNAPPPPVGKVSEEEKKIIFARGPLNDVATCFYIVGQAEEAQGRIEAARAAYTKATTYTYARTWDPKGWFWNPAEGGKDHLAMLKTKK